MSKLLNCERHRWEMTPSFTPLFVGGCCRVVLAFRPAFAYLVSLERVRMAICRYLESCERSLDEARAILTRAAWTGCSSVDPVMMRQEVRILMPSRERSHCPSSTNVVGSREAEGYVKQVLLSKSRVPAEQGRGLMKWPKNAPNTEKSRPFTSLAIYAI